MPSSALGLESEFVYTRAPEVPLRLAYLALAAWMMPVNCPSLLANEATIAVIVPFDKPLPGYDPNSIYPYISLRNGGSDDLLAQALDTFSIRRTRPPTRDDVNLVLSALEASNESAPHQTRMEQALAMAPSATKKTFDELVATNAEGWGYFTLPTFRHRIAWSRDGLLAGLGGILAISLEFDEVTPRLDTPFLPRTHHAQTFRNAMPAILEEGLVRGRATSELFKRIKHMNWAFRASEVNVELARARGYRDGLAGDEEIFDRTARLLIARDAITGAMMLAAVGQEAARTGDLSVAAKLVASLSEEDHTAFALMVRELGASPQLFAGDEEPAKARAIAWFARWLETALFLESSQGLGWAPLLRKVDAALGEDAKPTSFDPERSRAGLGRIRMQHAQKFGPPKPFRFDRVVR